MNRLFNFIPRIYRYLLKITFYLCLGILTTLGLPAISAQKTTVQPSELARQGKELYEAGQLNRAAEIWQEAAAAYSTAGNSQASIESLINTATAQQGLGLYEQSCQTILNAFDFKNHDCELIKERVLPLEQKLATSLPIYEDSQTELVTVFQPILDRPNSLNKTRGLLRLGDYFSHTEYLQIGEELLSLSLDTAKQINSLSQQVSALLSLGNTARSIALRQQNQFPPQTVALNIIANQDSSTTAALAPYQPAIDYYQQVVNTSPSDLDTLKAELNHLSLLLDAWEFWQQATTELSTKTDLIDITDANFLSLIKNGALNLQFQLAQELQPQIITLSNKIKTKLNNLPPSRAGVYAKVNFAQSLIRQGITNSETAAYLATAIKEAQQIDNIPAEAEANGYLGLLYEQKQQYPEARRLTEQALQLAPAVQYPEIAYRWHRQLGRILEKQGDRQKAIAAYDTSFNTIKALRSDLATTPVEPIFREYVSLLLQSDPSSQQLTKARDVLESLQIAEIDNFFRDPCSPVAEEPVIIDEVDKQAAVIYPIILGDRLEVIATIPEQDLRRYSANVSNEEVQATIKQLRRQVFNNPGFAEEVRGARGNPEQQQRLQQTLQESLTQDILPLSQQLYNWLIAPIATDLKENQVKTLVFVLDGPLRNIPMSLLYDGEKYLIEQDYNVALSSGLQLTAPRPLKRQPLKVLAAGVTKNFPRFDFPPIPQVEAELNQIKAIFGESEILLNREFTQNKLQQKLRETDFPVVHLATHGQFSSTSDRTFLVSGDEQGNEVINVNQLDNLLRVRSLGNTAPIELLVLSACNTAEGDNRAILGLAGVAVRAGARSTLATLWAANDEATAELMGYFYQNLAKDTQISKAQALREAQLTLLQISESQYRHPYYWAPFVLVGNWL
ncbi:MAG: CHAT domain-containing protein [Xenococcaceae cyanobacterium MO_188.B32]|nr:CHAT domain-containing protein [Xenococcaceae cyanobacterium MO_188.B32]